MKNIRHHTIIITGNDKAKLERLRNEVINLYKEKMEAKKGFTLVSPIVDSLINNFCTFFIAPDGSKEGYESSEDGDIIRKYVIELLKKQKDADGEDLFRFVEVFYGDDNKESRILNHN